MDQLSVLRISPENVATCKAGLGALRENRQELMQLTKLQPVPCLFSGVSYVLTEAKQVDLLIEELSQKIEGFTSEGRRKRSLPVVAQIR